MAAIIQPQPWTRQPQYPVGINRSGIGRGIIQAVLPGFGIGTLTSGITLGAESQGRHYSIPYATSDVITVPSKGYATGTQPFSCLAVCRINGVGVNRVIMAGTYDGTSVPFILSAGGVSAGMGYYSGGWKTSGITDSTFAGDSKWHVIAGATVSGSQRLFIDGKLDAATTQTGTSATNSSNLQFGNYAASVVGLGGDVAMFLLWDRFLSDSEFADVSRNPWQVLAPLPRRIFVGPSAGGGSVTGTVAYTNANDTSAASGTTTIVGTLAKTNANDTSAASGTTTVLGTLARTNANDTSAASGTVGAGGSSGTVAYTNANDTVVASGKTTIIGVLAKTNANDAMVAAGWAGRITGTLAKTNANDTVVANGTSGTAIVSTVAPPEPNSISWAALVAKTWGKDYEKPEWDYEFSNGRRFLEKKNPYA